MATMPCHIATRGSMHRPPPAVACSLSSPSCSTAYPYSCSTSSARSASALNPEAQMADKLTGAQGAADASHVDAAAAENQSVRDLLRKLDENAKRVSKAREDRFCTYQEEFSRICASSLETQEMMANQLPLVYKLIRGLIPGAAAGVGGSPGAGSAEQEAGGGSNSPATISRICATLLEREETLADHLSLLHKLIQELIPGAGAVAVAMAAGAGGSRGAGSPEQEAGGGSNNPVTITKPHRKRQRGVELKGPDHRSR